MVLLKTNCSLFFAAWLCLGLGRFPLSHPWRRGWLGFFLRTVISLSLLISALPLLLRSFGSLFGILLLGFQDRPHRGPIYPKKSKLEWLATKTLELIPKWLGKAGSKEVASSTCFAPSLPWSTWDGRGSSDRFSRSNMWGRIFWQGGETQ